MEQVYRLTISCPDRVGIVAKVGEFVSSHGGWIVEANHYADTSVEQGGSAASSCVIALRLILCRLA